MVVVGKAQEVMSQQSIVGRAVLIEETDVGLNVADSKGLTVTITHVDTIENCPHTVAVGLGSTTGEGQQKDENGQQMFHLVCMVVCNLLLIQFLLVYCPPRIDDVSQYEGDDETDIEHGAQGELTAA